MTTSKTASVAKATAARIRNLMEASGYDVHDLVPVIYPLPSEPLVPMSKEEYEEGNRVLKPLLEEQAAAKLAGTDPFNIQEVDWIAEWLGVDIRDLLGVAV